MIQLAPETDQAVIFGKHQNLVGVWSEPIAHKTSDPEIAVIMVTAGMIHHSGPFRMHVELARQLSRQGVASLRFDLSGIGESLGVGADGSSLDRAANEIGQAIDYLTEHFGIKEVILFGLCSGADDSIHTATIDARVRGVIAMDGCGYRTRKFYWHRIMQHYLPRTLKLEKWINLARRFSHERDDVPQSLKFGDDIREFPSRLVAESQLIELTKRETRMHFIYTGGVGDYYNHESQFKSMFPKLADSPEISHRYFGHMDHVAFLAEDRSKLTRHVADEISKMAAEV